MGLRQKYRAWRLKKCQYIDQPVIAQLDGGIIPGSLPGSSEYLSSDHMPLRPLSASQINRYKRQNQDDKREEATRSKKGKTQLTNSISNPILRSSFHRQGPPKSNFSTFDSTKGQVPGLSITEIVEELATLTQNMGIEQPSADFGVWESRRPVKGRNSGQSTLEYSGSQEHQSEHISGISGEMI